MNRLKGLRNLLIDTKRFIFNRFWGMHIHPTANFSLSAYFNRPFPSGVHIGAYSYSE